MLPAPSAPCENPGLEPRRVPQLPQCNESPGNTYPSHFQALNSRRGWPGCSSHRKAQLDHTLGWGTCPISVPAGTPWLAHQQALGVSRLGVWVVLLFLNQNRQVTSFSCMCLPEPFVSIFIPLVLSIIYQSKTA